MQPQLPIFEGEQPHASTLRLKGTSAQRIGALRRHEEGFAVIKFVVDEVNHKDQGKDPIMVREHVAELVSLYILSPDEGEQMLAEAQMMSDERFGVLQLLGAEGGDGGDGGLPGEEP